MAVTITMPKLGLTMNSGSVAEWKKQIGDPVKKGEILYVVATDKLTVDVESPSDGVLLAITIKPGEEVKVGESIGTIGEPGEKVDSAPASVESAVTPSAPSVAAPAVQTAAPSARGERVPSSPKAKKIAREKGIDLNTVTPTGPNGWIVAKDVQNASTTPKTSPVAAKMAADAGVDLTSVNASSSRIMKADVAAAMGQAGTDVAPCTSVANERRIPMTQMRRVIAGRMLASTTSIPSVHYFADVDMTALSAMRADYNDRLAKKEGAIKISVNDILMKFCAKLLMDCPLLNGSVEQDSFVMHDYVNIGFAVALPGGLMVPNIKNVQNRGLESIAHERAELVSQTRKGGLSPDSMSGGTFTISNLGMMGVDTFTPIINPPEVAILGVGTTREIPVVKNGEIVIRPIATLCLAADHRLVDGADAAEFIAKLRELIEAPSLFLL